MRKQAKIGEKVSVYDKHPTLHEGVITNLKIQLDDAKWYDISDVSVMEVEPDTRLSEAETYFMHLINTCKLSIAGEFVVYSTDKGEEFMRRNSRTGHIFITHMGALGVVLESKFALLHYLERRDFIVRMLKKYLGYSVIAPNPGTIKEMYMKEK